MKACNTTRVPGLMLIGGLAALGASAQPGGTDADKLPRDKSVGKIEVVATFHGPMPTGVTVSHEGRKFVNFPRWGDKVEFTVAEVKDGQAVAYPSAEANHWDKEKPGEGLLSVQSVVVDPRDRLWCLDTGSTNFGPIVPGAPKLVGVDLKSNKIFKTIYFPKDVALTKTYLNDIRFDLGRGKEGMAFIADSSGENPGIIVVDLASGKSWRHLTKHNSTMPVPKFLPFVEGRALMERDQGKTKHLAMGSDGVAISADGKRLYYCPLSSRHLYSVSTDALAKSEADTKDVDATVKDHGDRGFASDGLESDDKGRIYLTDYEHNAIHRWHPDHADYETLVHDPRVLWPDTLSVATDGYLYFTANQLHRQKKFHDGKDLRQKPYSLLRVKIDAGPVLLK